MLFRSAGFYLLRTPALPFSAGYQNDRSMTEQLINLWQQGSLAEAVFVASPSLFDQIQSHIQSKGWPLNPTLHHSLCKYAIRMSSRATPFGLMAGCSVGTISTETRIRLGTEHRAVQHRRLDMDCFASLIRQLENDPIIRPQLCFQPNNSLYRVGDELRYVEQSDLGSDRHYFVSSVTASAYLTTVLQWAASGSTPDELIKQLTGNGVNDDEAAAFINQLIEQQLLISELEPALTSPSMLTDLLSRLGQLAGTESALAALRQVANELANPKAYASHVHSMVRKALRTHFTDLPSQHLIQTDLLLNLPTNELNQRTVQTILQQLERLRPLQQTRSNQPIEEFARRFRERYDAREIPLSEALDGELGVGYGSNTGTYADYVPLLDNLTIPEPDSTGRVTWEAYEHLQLTKYSQALRTHFLSVELTDQDLDQLPKAGQSSLPASFYVFGNLLSVSREQLDQGKFRFNLLAAEGPSAATLLGRFCAHSAELTDYVRACLQREEQRHPDAIYAEIVHWPDDRLGNVLIRPTLRDYEIPYISRASVDNDHQLPLSDLLVSVQADGYVRVRSKRHGKEVIPRLSTAHNYTSGLSVYQFLADLQRQAGTLSLRWDWGPLRNQPFLPRITYQNLILSRARWTINRDTLPIHLADIKAYLQTTYQLPRWIAVSSGDNELVLDLQTETGQQLLEEEIKRKPVTQLIEWVATPDQCWLRDEQGQAFVNELIIPCETAVSGSASAFVQAGQKERGLSQQVDNLNHREKSPQITRSFEPGTEWLYIKLYSGTQTTDELLTQIIWPFVIQLRKEAWVDDCFFIRYADPAPHLRLRIHGSKPNFYSRVLDRLNEQLTVYRQSGKVYRVQLDTYERELERYGAHTMLDSEKLFAADSYAILDYLSQEMDATERWRFAVQSCDALLTDFDLSLLAKVSLLRGLQEQFLNEHRADKQLRKQLNARFREKQALITHDLVLIDQAVATLPGTHTNESPTSVTILADRSKRIRPLADHIQAQLNGETDYHPILPNLLASYLHMSLNRLFASQQRAQEMVIYHYLARHYESLLARKGG